MDDKAYMQEIKGFVEMMELIDSKDKLVDSSKAVLPYLLYLLDEVKEKDKLIQSLMKEYEDDKRCIGKMAKRIKSLEEKYLYS